MSPADPQAGAGSVDELAAQEERLVLDTFGNDEAWELGSLLRWRWHASAAPR